MFLPLLVSLMLWRMAKDCHYRTGKMRLIPELLPWNNSLLIIGGETAGGKAVTDSVLISVKDNKVTVQN